ncbi:hypothetical protein ANCCAN_06098 [Ancylostoma caninum]|uniref:Uncharacterized protein n=1 Tax=Ancylostoma caninum TaxID=29170 RepID=A0A368GUB2_ANCCA|nr:hypothetical protein ANCCAN_06098 [Ancylostoma caninum]
MDVDGFPEYARPSQGFTYTTYIKWSSRQRMAIKYSNKYVYKGPDRARLIKRSSPDADSIEYGEIRS